MSARFMGLLLLVLFVGMQLVFITPIAFQVSWGQLDTMAQQNGIQPLWRTLGFASASALFATAVAFVLALTLWRLPITALGFFGFALLPALIGNVGLAVLTSKTGWWPQWLQDRQSFGTWLFLLAVELLQWTPVFTLLIWLKLRNLPDRYVSLSVTARFTMGESLYYIVYPHLRDLMTLLIVVGYVSGAAEYAKSQVILRVSRGTNTEFVSHWLERFYRQIQAYDPAYATSQSMGMSGWFAVLLLLGCLCTVALSRMGAHPLFLMVKHLAASTRLQKKDEWSYRSIAVLGLVSVGALSPLVPFFMHPASPAPEMVAVLTEVAPLAVATGILVGVISITVAICMRVALPRRLECFSARSMPIFLGLFTFRFIPAVGLGFCAYFWLQEFLALGAGVLTLSWIAAQILVVAPFLVAFSLVVNFAVRRNELVFSKVYSLSFRELALTIFTRRSLVGYLLVILFAVSFVWNEDSVTSVLSVHVPSFAPKLLSKVTGRSANWRDAATLLSPVLAFSATASVIWAVLFKMKVGFRNGAGNK